VFVSRQLAPALADDFAVERRAHVADHERFHSFQQFLFLERYANAFAPRGEKFKPRQ
jgi:hypothetical protein